MPDPTAPRIFKFRVPKQDVSVLMIPAGATLHDIKIQKVAPRPAIYEVRYEGVEDVRVTIAAASEHDVPARATAVLPTGRIESIRRLREGTDGTEVMLWAEVNPSQQEVPVVVFMVPTGAEMPMGKSGYKLQRLGMIQFPLPDGGEAVFHYYADTRLLRCVHE